MALHLLGSHCIVEFALQLQQILLQEPQRGANHLVGLDCVGLYFDFEDVLEGMGYFVACELDLFVFEEVYSE